MDPLGTKRGLSAVTSCYSSPSLERKPQALLDAAKIAGLPVLRNSAHGFVLGFRGLGFRSLGFKRICK